MRYLIIADVHSNLEALKTVLDAAEGSWDTALCLGDLVGYGPNPNECVETVRGLNGLSCVIGNHDVAALGQIDLDTFNPLAKFAAVWTKGQMSDETKGFLESLGQVEEMGATTLVHGSPRDPIWEYLEYPSQAPENFARFTTKLCFNGHTHVPKIFSQDAEDRRTEVRVPDPDEVVDTADEHRFILNPGSVGQPRDGDPRAAYAIFDADGERFEYHRVAYDVEATQKKMADARLPQALADRLAYGF
ncbi:MAG TPA: metallophosphoesterase family protein [Chloroflexota bacterium]|nr:metallophosphoesterase family protein [Chloroflexota bacterium]